jgi:hypothetical protein
MFLALSSRLIVADSNWRSYCRSRKYRTCPFSTEEGPQSKATSETLYSPLVLKSIWPMLARMRCTKGAISCVLVDPRRAEQTTINAFKRQYNHFLRQYAHSAPSLKLLCKNKLATYDAVTQKTCHSTIFHKKSMEIWGYVTSPLLHLKASYVMYILGQRSMNSPRLLNKFPETHLFIDTKEHRMQFWKCIAVQ